MDTNVDFTKPHEGVPPFLWVRCPPCPQCGLGPSGVSTPRCFPQVPHTKANGRVLCRTDMACRRGGAIGASASLFVGWTTWCLAVSNETCPIPEFTCSLKLKLLREGLEGWFQVYRQLESWTIQRQRKAWRCRAFARDLM